MDLPTILSIIDDEWVTVDVHGIAVEAWPHPNSAPIVIVRARRNDASAVTDAIHQHLGLIPNGEINQDGNCYFLTQKMIESIQSETVN